nr:YdbH domain-containing protein [uncultured Sphingomonas sp.]
MSEGVRDGPAEEVGEVLEEAGLAEPVMVRTHGRWHRVRRISTIGIAVVTALAIIAGFALWLQRKAIADRLIAEELAKRGVQGSYTIRNIGLRTQEITDVVIGDPARPDLTAAHAIVQTRVRWNGSVEVYRIAAEHVRLRARVIGSTVSFGQIDKLLPPPSGKPFTLPNITVDLRDARMSLRTPYGPMGFALDGRGNLSGGFTGRLAAAAPALAPGNCRLDQFKALVAVGVEARRPLVRGPVWAEAFRCPASRIALNRPRVDLDSNFSEAFGSFDGKGRLTLETGIIGVNGVAGMVSNVSFKGSPTNISGSISLAARQAKMAQILAQQTRFNGRYRLNARSGRVALLGEFDGRNVALSPALTTGMTSSLAGLKQTPVGPIAEAWLRAAVAAGRDFRATGALTIVNNAGGGGVRIREAVVQSASGAKTEIRGGDGVTFYWPENRLRIDGNFETSGGGLPTATLNLAQPRSGAPMSGSASIAPYAAGGASLTLSTAKFAAQRDGSTRVSAEALMSGPFPGGRVEGLRLPIVGRIGPNGGLALGEGCLDTRFAALSAGALRVGPTNLPLCATQGTILRKVGNSPLTVGFINRNTRLRGRIGRSPFALDAASTRFEMGPGFLMSALRARLGQSDAPVLINADKVAGKFAGSGARGTFSGGDALIGKVPLKLGEMAGTWLFHKGDVTLDGGATVSDTADPSRFYPLNSDNLHFTLVNNVIRANGGLKHPDSGTHIMDVDIAHRLSSGDGYANLSVPGIQFGEALQPEELTRLTQGVIALVQGTVRGQGRIDWNGNGNVTSSGDFTTDNANFAASFGPVTGLAGTIHFTDLLGLQTAPGQVVTLESVNAGIVVEDGVIHYQLLPDNLVKIERGEWPFMGGRLILQETILNFGRPSPKRLTFEVVGLDAKTFIDSMGFKEIGATGVFDGVLPMIFDEEGGRIVGGRLDSRAGGGTLSYHGVVNRANLGMMGGMAFDALRDLKFKSMIIRLDGYLDGEFATRLTIDGVGLGNTSTQRLLRSVNKIPFKFNVSIKGPFRALIATAKSFRDPTDAISPALPMPLNEVPGIIIETRNRSEELDQTQTPVDQKVTVSADPNKKP